MFRKSAENYPREFVTTADFYKKQWTGLRITCDAISHRSLMSALLYRQRLLPHCIFLLGFLPGTASLQDSSFYRLQLIYVNHRHWSCPLISLPCSCSCTCSKMCEHCSVAGQWPGLLPLSVAFSFALDGVTCSEGAVWASITHSPCRVMLGCSGSTASFKCAWSAQSRCNGQMYRTYHWACSLSGIFKSQVPVHASSCGGHNEKGWDEGFKPCVHTIWGATAICWDRSYGHLAISNYSVAYAATAFA